MAKEFLRMIRIFGVFVVFVLFGNIAAAQFWDSWSNTYSPTWTPLSLDQMTSNRDSSYRINTYPSSTTSSTTTTTKTPPPSDLLIPEGGKGIRISKNGVLRYLDNDTVLPFGTKSNFETKEITFVKNYITFKVGIITHSNIGADSFGYVHPSRFEIDTAQYKSVSDAAKAPENFAVPEGAIGVRVKEWGDVQYLNNNMRVSGAKGNFSSAKIVDALDSTTEVGVITVNNYKQYDNVDSFGYLYPTKLWYAFYQGNGKDSFGLPLPPADFAAPEGMLGVRIGDWGNVYYLKDNTLVSKTALGKLDAYTYDAATQKMVPATQLNIVDKDAEGKEKEIGAITHYIQDADIYSYGYVFAPATETPATETPATETPATETPATETPATETPATETPPTEIPPTDAPQPDILVPSNELPFKDILEDAPYAAAVRHAFKQGWIPSAVKFKPKVFLTRCTLKKILKKASGTSMAKAACKKIRRKTLQSLLKKMTGRTATVLQSNPKKYVRKSEAVMALYEVFGVSDGAAQ